MKTINSITNTQKVGTIEKWHYFPKYLQIETVSLCNARCIMCPVGEWKRNNKIMKNELFNKIVSELSLYSNWIEKVTVQLDGEPLIDNKLENKIKLLKNAGIKCVAFASNASLMDTRRAESIVLSGVDEVSFSIDGVTEKTFEKIRKKLNFTECIYNVDKFIKIRNSLNPNLSVRIRMTIQELNSHEYKDFLIYWKKRLSPNDSCYGKRLHNWANWMKDYSVPIEQNKFNLNNTPCTSLWNSFVILSDGYVPLCCSDYNANILLGDVNKSIIQDIWQNKKFVRIRSLHISEGRESINICKDCNVWDSTTKVKASN